MGTREFLVGQVHGNVDFILTSVARGDRVEVKNRARLIAIFRKATEADKAIATRHLQGDFTRQASSFLKNISTPFLITGAGGGILAVVEPKSSPA